MFVAMFRFSILNVSFLAANLRLGWSGWSGQYVSGSESAADTDQPDGTPLVGFLGALVVYGSKVPTRAFMTR